MKSICTQLDLTVSIPDKLVWETQVNVVGCFIDMLCKTEDCNFIFEHKAWSGLHENQLQNYRNVAKEHYSNNYKLILITGATYQHIQDPDLALCWSDVYEWIEEWQKNHENEFMFEHFKSLLVQDKLGPPEPISYESILAYIPSNKLEPALEELLKRLKSSDNWEELIELGKKHEELDIQYEKPKWGRIGLIYFASLNPGLFAGFLLNGDDHCVELKNPQCPDCSIIFDIHNYYEYASNRKYQKLLK